MAWIEFHGTTIKKLQKFREFRRDLQWEENYALGFLASLWSEVMDLCEDGDISNWTSEYLCELTGVSTESGRVWKALKDHGWIDETEDNHTLIHDWLATSGAFLIRKYSTNDKKKLKNIWKLYGRCYGAKYEKSKQSTATKQRANSEQKASLPFLSFPLISYPLPSYPYTQEGAFEILWKKYPRQLGKKKAFSHFCSSVREVKDWEDINKALENYIKSDTCKNGYIQHGSTWFYNWRDYVNTQAIILGIPKVERRKISRKEYREKTGIDYSAGTVIDGLEIM